MPYNPVAFKERDLRRALRSALKEDLTVNGYEIMRDGTIRVLTAPSDHPPAIEPAQSPGSAA
jgi:hypothetical protein